MTDAGERAGRYLHVAVADIDSRVLPEFCAWVDDTHLPEATASGTWSRARRFSCVGDAATLLLIYDLAPDVAVPATVPAVFRSALGARWVRTYLADTVEQTSSYGKVGFDPQFLNAISVQTLAHETAAFDRWYDEIHVPEIVACPGWLGARRFRSVCDPARVLAIYDLQDAERPFSTPEYEAAVGWDELDRSIVGYHGFRTYELGGRSP